MAKFNYGEIEFYNNIRSELIKGIKFIVSSHRWCQKGYSEIYIKHKVGRGWSYPLPDKYKGCRPNAEIEKLKTEIIDNIKEMEGLIKLGIDFGTA